MGKVDPDDYFADAVQLQFHPPAGEDQLRQSPRRPPQRGPQGTRPGTPEAPVALEDRKSVV